MDRATLFRKAAKKLRDDFDALSPIPHSAVKGGEAEKIVKEFLSGLLPKRFGVGSGFIIDPNGKVSKQTDVVVYDALNAVVFKISDELSIFDSTNVAAVIEVKSKFNRKELGRAFENISQTKQLSKENVSRPQLALSTYQTLGCMFCFDTDVSLDSAVSSYAQCLRQQGGVGWHIDLICILGAGIISLSASLADGNWAPAFVETFPDQLPEGGHLGIGALPLKSDALDGFVRLLLPQLSNFVGTVPHPGFNWDQTESKGQAIIQYVTSFTNEKDPILRNQKLAEYRTAYELSMKGKEVPKS